MKSRLYSRHNLPLLFTLLLTLGSINFHTVVTAQPNPVDPALFEIRSYGGKCLDFGAPPQISGAPVFIYDCNGTIAQEVRIQEVNEFHDVILRAGNKVIGVKDEPVIGSGEGTGDAESEPVIQLQELQDLNTVLARKQIFALDGDSIMLAANRKLVIKVQNSRGTSRTPLVMGRRELADAEFWTFRAKDNSNRRPTTGFKIVPADSNPNNDDFEFADAVLKARKGTVIELRPGVSIDLSNQYPIVIQEGVTIRGDRRFTRLGSELFVRPGNTNNMLEVFGADVRITGLRLRGPSRSKDSDTKGGKGIVFQRDKLLVHGIIVDHNDFYDWPIAAVSVGGEDLTEECQAGDNNHGSPQENVRVVRNSFHHNRKQGEGYGVSTGVGGQSLIDGNTFWENRHAIKGGGEARTIYRAWNNLVLRSAPKQRRLGFITWYTHDFDMHGTDNTWHHPAGFGGTGGQYIQIRGNTFLGTNRNNFKLRGEPCHLAEYHFNVSRRKRNDAVTCDQCGNSSKLIYPANQNQFEAGDPTTKLGVGDFDGDGREDVFLATGAAWYYAPHGIVEWRFLNANTETLDNLRFGDFDLDGRTDVFTQHSRNWDVSWGGVSRWEKINESNPALADLRVGDFRGDRRPDVFYSDGQHWWLSDGGVGPFVQVNDSGYRAFQLGFGDFNGDGKMDVAGVSGGMWAASLSATGAWTDFPLRAKLTSSMTGLIVADLNGNGIADILNSDAKKVSYDGKGTWTSLPSRPGKYAAVGRFNGANGADILFYWNDENYFGIKSSGVGASIRHSTQDMR